MPFLSGSKHLQQEDMQWMPGQPERKGGIEKKQNKNSNWAASVKKKQKCEQGGQFSPLISKVSKLHALGFQPILFLGQFDRKGRIVGDVIT
ncbi:unnamed protein product [Oreochromis niloticus]|nr:unnamed protein product [Mustela putorius furo]